jgi:hypothetical protein
MAGMFREDTAGTIEFQFNRNGNITSETKPINSHVISFRSGARYDEDHNFSSPAEIFQTAKEAGGDLLRDRYDTGHEFESYKERFNLSNPDVTLRNSTGEALFHGPLRPSFKGKNTYIPLELIPESNTQYYGPRLIRKAIPTHPVAGLSQFLGELEQFPRFFVNPNLFRSKIDFFHNLGDDYLNVAFGWRPFIGDLIKMAMALQKYQKLFIQYSRDSGRIVRRKRYEQPIKTTQLETLSTSTPFNLISYLDGNRMAELYPSGPPDVNITRVDTVNERYWFSGAFTYYAPPLDINELQRLDRLEPYINRLLGTRLTPSVLYELTPWSWLVDWVSSLGDSISNAVNLQSDGLVMRYGYLMRETLAETTITVSLPDDYFNFVKFPNGVQAYGSAKLKQRFRATPYGFGINPASFSEQQWAILGALGLTKGTQILRYR